MSYKIQDRTNIPRLWGDPWANLGYGWLQQLMILQRLSSLWPPHMPSVHFVYPWRLVPAVQPILNSYINYLFTFQSHFHLQLLLNFYHSTMRFRKERITPISRAFLHKQSIKNKNKTILSKIILKLSKFGISRFFGKVKFNNNINKI